MALTLVKGNMIEDGAITDSKFSNTTITSADMALDPRNASNISSGQVPLAQLDNMPAADLSSLDDDIALLGFKAAANGSLAKYNLLDQTVDAFEDASGVDASASTDAARNAAKYYSGSATGAATGGTVVSYTVGATNYKSNTFTADGSLVVPSAGSVDYLIVAGGGGGGNAGANTGHWGAGGGGGAGGFLTDTAVALTAQTYTITVGDGGAAGGYQTAASGAQGGNSSIVPVTSGTSYIATGGGGGASSIINSVGGNGGSGGGGSYAARASGTGTAGPPRQGYDGGTNTFVNAGAGGGGAGAQGGASVGGGGPGGTGISNNYRDGTAGTTIATNYFAGGGGGGTYASPNGPSPATYGGGAGGLRLGTNNGTSNGVAGTANSGGGGGGGSPDVGNSPATSGAGGDGGKGIVVVRYVDTTFGSVSNMTLVSNLTAAQVAPTKGDVVFTYTNGAGTAVINTNITAEVSADNGSTWTLFSGLTSQGTTGGHTIVSAHDQTITSTITAPYNMRYRIKTLVQSASMDTRIQAVSLGWS